MAEEQVLIRVVGDSRSGVAAVDAVTTSLGEAEVAAKSTQSAAQRMASGVKTRMGQVAGAARSMTLPLIGAGFVVGKMAMDFEDSMNQIKYLVGFSQKQIDDWSNKLLKLAPQLGKSPNELAKALYFVTSSGVDASKALGVVEESAKASALGLGETQQVADAVTSAMNAYSKENLTAAEATNALALAVKFGKGEASSFPPVMGRILPVAAKLGVSFNEVAAGLAATTLQGATTAEAGTGIRAVMTSLLNPTEKAQKMFAEWGTSAEALREELKEKGLLALLGDVSTKAHGNVEAIQEVFPNIRALVSAFNLTGQNADQTKHIFAELNTNTDIVSKGFKELSESPAQEARRAIAGLQADAVKLGTTLISAAAPAVKELTEMLNDPHLTTEQKISKAMETIVDDAAKLAPKIADAGAMLAGDLAKGFLHAWLNSNPLEKLFLGAGALRLIGGPGVFSRIGGMAASGFSSGMKRGLASEGEKVLPAGGGFVGGMKAGMLSIGKTVLALALAQGILSGLGTAITDSRGQNLGDFLHNTGVGFFGSFGIDIGESTAEQFSKGFKTQLHDLATGREGFGLQDTLTPQIEQEATEMAESRISARFPGRGGTNLQAVPQFGDAYGTAMRELQEQVKASYPKAEQMFAGLWDQMKPGEKKFSGEVRRALIQADQLSKHFHLSSPKLDLETNPKGLIELQKNLKELASGAVSSGKDISAVLKQSMHMIASDPNLNGAQAKEAIAAQFKAAAMALAHGFATHTIPETRKNLEKVRRLLNNARLLSGDDPLGLARGFKSSWGHAETISEQSMNKLDDQMKKLPPKARKRAGEAMLQYANELERKGELSKNKVKALESYMAQRWDLMSSQAKTGSGHMMVNVVKNFGSLAEGVGEALGIIRDNTNKGLSKFGVKEIKFALKTAGNLLSFVGLQRGGHLDGHREGDLNPAMLEDGEYVVNKKAVRAVGKRALDEINFGIAPRFAAGGQVEVGGANMSVGQEPIILGDLKALSAELHKIVYVISGYRTPQHSVEVGGFPDDPHTKGEAADIGVGSALRDSMFGVSEAALKRVGLYRPFYPADPNEVNHVQLLAGGAGGARGTASVAASLLPHIGRILMGGEGPLKDMGQADIDKVTKAANELLKKEAGRMGGIGGLNVKTGPIQKMAREMVMGVFGPGEFGYFNALEEQEAGWDPTAVNPESGAAGLAQALPPSKYPPGAWPYTGLQSAKKQLQWMVSYIKGRYGSPAGAMAHENSYGWYSGGGEADHETHHMTPSEKRTAAEKKKHEEEKAQEEHEETKKEHEVNAIAKQILETDFGPLPGTIKGCSEEMGLRKKQLRRMQKLVTNKSSTTIGTNAIEKLKKRISDLKSHRQKLIKAARTKVVKGIAKRALFGPQISNIERAEGHYNIDQQDADKAVALEPQELDDAYVAGEEKKYNKVLNDELNWRNVIVEAQNVASNSIESMRVQIEEIESTRRAAPKVFANEKYKIPGLKQAIKDSITMRDDTWENELIQLQGFGGGHAILTSLPAMMGGPGHLIFDTQNTVRELGLKEDTSDTSNRDAMLELEREQALNALKAANLRNVHLGTIDSFLHEVTGLPFVGAFEKGGVAPLASGQAGLAVLHGPETIIPEGSTLAGEGSILNLHLYGDMRDIVHAHMGDYQKTVDRDMGRKFRKMTFAPGRGS
jgi:TP901 family phage tail tape measure protein